VKDLRHETGTKRVTPERMPTSGMRRRSSLSELIPFPRRRDAIPIL
jgi:hypothetical protein